MKRTVSTSLFVMLLTSMLCSAFKIMPAEAAGTIYIRADGSIDPPTAPISSLDNVTYTFTGNTSDHVEVYRNNIIIDGAGHKLQGSGSSSGIYLYYRSNVTIMNMEIRAFNDGIHLQQCSGINIVGNSIVANNGSGVDVTWFSIHNNISGNNVADNGEGGISVSLNSSENTISLNNIAGNSMYGVTLGSLATRNSVSQNNITASSSHGIYIYRASYNLVARNNITGNLQNGIKLYNSSDHNSIVENNIVSNHYGIYVYCPSDSSTYPSSFTNISQNNISANDEGGILFSNLRTYASLNNDVIGNLIAGNNGDGIVLGGNTLSNNVSQNEVTHNVCGIRFWESSGNLVYKNNITNNSWEGIHLTSSSEANKVNCNVISGNVVGVWLEDSLNNTIYHNDFVNNGLQVLADGSVNFWDNGSPSGGNYWSDYTGVDANHDGIGDTPYVVDANNTDHYPLVNPYLIPEFPSFLILLLCMTASLLAMAICKRRKRFHSKSLVSG